MIEAMEMKGVFITELDVISNRRGSVMKMMNENTYIGGKYDQFESLGEIYFSTIVPNVVKAWHGHKVMTMNYACIYGRIIVGLCDMRVGSTFGKTAQVYMDSFTQYKLLTIPPGVWNGFRVHPDEEKFAIVANAASCSHDPDEIERIHPKDFPIPFDWGDYEVAG
jgi:dTDP-4-dehydrorhamnose 3,5-epimerase